MLWQGLSLLMLVIIHFRDAPAFDPVRERANCQPLPEQRPRRLRQVAFKSEPSNADLGGFEPLENVLDARGFKDNASPIRQQVQLQLKKGAHNK